MHIISPENPEHEWWQANLGVSRAFLIQKLFATSWQKKYHKGARIEVTETIEPERHLYALEFGEIAMKLYEPGDQYVHFTLEFNYKGVRSDMHISDVFLEAIKGRGAGTDLLKGVIEVARASDVDRLFVWPVGDGAGYWPSRGAVISAWPDDDVFMQSLDTLLGCWRFMGALDCDVKELARVVRDEDSLGLSRMLARDDLYVKTNLGDMRLRRYLSRDATFPICVFDFDHTFTRECFKERLSVDVSERGPVSEAVRPVNYSTRPLLTLRA